MTLLEAVESFDVAIPATGPSGGTVALPGRLTLPAPPTGLVLFAHGSGSSRLSPRNEFVASVLHESWIGTLLFDLLTEQEATDRVNVFDVALLAERLLAAVRFVAGLEQTRHLPLGLFGASTGAAAALGTSQPTLSRALARLEDELGVRVFERGVLVKNHVQRIRGPHAATTGDGGVAGDLHALQIDAIRGRTGRFGSEADAVAEQSEASVGMGVRALRGGAHRGIGERRPAGGRRGDRRRRGGVTTKRLQLGDTRGR